MHTIQSSRRQFLGAVGAGVLSAATRKPNLVFILADDLGWRDTGAYGSTFHQTPHIDALARRGMLFTQAYSANPLCSPTRSSIMTGLYPARTGITTPSAHLEQEIFTQTLQEKAPPAQKALQANSVTRLKQEYFTLAEALKEAGYATAHFGKWHLGHEPYDPLHQGFDSDLPHTPGPAPVGGYLAPWRFWPNQGKPGDHIDDRLSEDAARFIAAHKHHPFYLNYWAFSVHSPWNAKLALIEKYRGKADPKNPQHSPLYAAMVESLDDAVGRLTDALNSAGVIEDTIVIFFSDNGGWIWPPNPQSLMHPEYAGVPATSNAPLRGGKATLYEGGTREPCIIAWPGRIKAGARSDAVISSIDFYPTILEMTGVPRKPRQQFDGISFHPALKGKPLKRDAIFCHFPHYTPATGAKPATWVRQGDWKLIRFYCDNDDQSDRLELYNLKEDLSETNNLSPHMPDKARRLNQLIDGFLKDTGAIVPRPNPSYRRT
ncbi:MAG: sulfatase [Acidobacteria bacterium]|nr:sulfatase [Acidobacteriota bacterium]